MDENRIRKEVFFSSSMGADKRDADFAFLRKNVLKSPTKGIYPSTDFQQVNPAISSGSIVNIVGSDVSPFAIKVLVQTTGPNTVTPWQVGASGSSNTGISGTHMASAFGSDGVYFFVSDGKVYRANHTDSSSPQVGDLGSTSNLPEIGGFDGLAYWWVGTKIYRQLPNTNPVEAMSATGLDPHQIAFYRDYLIIFSQRGKDVVIAFWDKSDPTLYDKRVVVKNAKLMAGGVVDGKLMLVYAVGNGANLKELAGEIVVSAFDGEDFVRLNSIEIGNATISIVTSASSRGLTMDTGNSILLFAVNGNINSKDADLYQNYIYKVRADGTIEVQELPQASGASNNRASIVRTFFNRSVYTVNSPWTIYQNVSNNGDYDDYNAYTSTEYITNFLEEAADRHKLETFCVSFERLFKNTDNPGKEEKLEVYYRTSDRQPFVLLGEVTATKVIDNVNKRIDQSSTVPVPEQIYQFTKMPDGTSLPEFGEIQFKFKLYNGMSVIRAWYEYSNLTRNTRI